MQRLSAIDAISPAFTRTHEILFHPFRLGRSWKLALSAYLGFAGTVFVPVPLFFLFAGLLPGMRGGGARVLLAVAGTVSSLIFLISFYFCARMSLVNFETIVTRQTMIAPMWRRYSERVWPWIALKAAVGTGLTAAMTPMLIEAGKHFFAVMATMPRTERGQRADPVMLQHFVLQMVGFESVFFLCFAVLKLGSTLLDDFVLPFYLLENLALGPAMSRSFALFVADPLQVLLYLALKLVLATLGFMMQYLSNFAVILALMFVGLIVGGMGGGMIWLLGRATGLTGSPVLHVLYTVGGVLLYLVFVGVMLWAQLGTFGYLLMLLNAYATYFVGGRYPLLASLLEPGAGAPFTPPPVFPSRDERNDDDDGPPMPMNPAVA